MHSGMMEVVGWRNLKGVSSEYVDAVSESMQCCECSFEGDEATIETKVNVTANRTARRMMNELGSSL